jgi:dTDP-4-amino-4,6-dideoxygalactose transaminase
MDPAALEAAVTDKTKAIIVVHAFGQPADIDPILEIAGKHNLAVIEDACEAVGAQYKGHRVGTFAAAGVFAFYPNKQMTTGEGGMIVTDNGEWADLFRSLRNQGRDTFDAWLNHTRLGYNYRMDEMSAALGLAQIKRIGELLSKRDEIAALYNERIATIPGLSKPHIAQTTTRMSWFVYVVRCTEPMARDFLIKYLAEHGVPSRPYFMPIHLQPFYREKFGLKRGHLPHTETAGDTFLAVPFSGVMREEEVDYVCEQLRAGLEQFSLHFSHELA